jgi:hypothetical protein
MNTPTGRERTDCLRAIPLTDLLRAINAKPDPHDPVKWHTPRGLISVNGAKFFNWHESAGGGGAIDLAMHLMRLDFKEAIAWLAHLPAATCTAPPGHACVPPTDGIALPHAPRQPVLPVPAPDALPAIIGYLNGQRRLPMAMLQTLRASGDLYADRKRNAVFLLRNERGLPIGAEVRGTGGQTWRGMAQGSRKDNGYFALGPPHPKAIVLCESAIDAISCHTLHPDRLCISTSGARAHPAWMPPLLTRGLPIYCGFDNDNTGERMAMTMAASYPDVQRMRPPAHDWNDALRALP